MSLFHRGVRLLSGSPVDEKEHHSRNETVSQSDRKQTGKSPGTPPTFPARYQIARNPFA